MKGLAVQLRWPSFPTPKPCRCDRPDDPGVAHSKWHLRYRLDFVESTLSRSGLALGMLIIDNRCAAVIGPSKVWHKFAQWLIS